MKFPTIIPTTILLVTLPIFLTACGTQKDQGDYSEQSSTRDPAYEAVENNPKIDTKEDAADKNIFDSVRDAVNKRLVIKCQYISDDETFEMYLKGQTAAFQGESEVDNKKVMYHGLIVNNIYYLWSDESNEGASMDLTIKRDDPLEVNDKPVYSFDDVIDGLEQNKQSCQTVSVPDSMFEIPSTINFIAW